MSTFARIPGASRRFQPTACAVAIALIGSAAFAQPATERSLPGIVITGSPIIESNNLDGFAGLSTRVTDSQVRDLGALDLAAALRLTPGVQISRYNEVGSYSGDQGGNVYIRGIGASRPGSEIKTYLDGVPVYMGVWNHPLMDLLPLNGIRSIDIHKGPQNTASGNNFASINLQTKRALQDGLQADVNASAGSFATRVLQASVLGRKGDADFMLAAGRIESDGARANADGVLNNAMGRLTLRLGNAWAIGASFLAVGNKVGDPGDNRFPVSASPVGPYSFSNGTGRNDSSVNMLSAFLSHDHGAWKGELKVYDSRGRNDLANDANWGSFDSRFKMSGLRWKETLTPWRDGQLVAGIDQESVSGSVSGPHVGSPVGTPFGFGTAGSADIPSFRLLSAYAGLNQAFRLAGGWVLQPSASVRFYDHNRYASKAAPSAGVSLSSDSLTFYATYSKGLLYPGAETYTLTRAIPMAFAANNGWDRLSPSELKHSEIGLKWSPGADTQVDVSLFQDEVSKRYVWTGFFDGAIANPASGVWSNQFPAYKVSGAELSVRHRISRSWAVFGGLTTLDSSLSNLPYAPRHALSVGATGTIAGWRLAFDAHHQSRMFSPTQDRGSFTPNEVGSLTVANARIAYPVAALGTKGEIYLALGNLFGASYQYNAGYPMPGRHARVGVIANF
ncbi:MAG: TonB-dependent receptor plug domain-containing protein [Burkholderiaceae bacterium]|nr:TonB-dependent receptor plug domain-containing protein [Burkholderiaceae bacterium]